jgi:DNA-binding transcriptional MerR regulator
VRPPAREPLVELDEHIDTEDDEEQVGAIRGGRDVAASTDLTRGELVEATGLTHAQLDALESFGIIAPLPSDDGEARYDDEMLAVAELAAGCYRRGIEARHLKMYWHFAQREGALFAQVLLPYVKQRNPASRAKLQGELEELARLGRRLRTAMLRRALRSTLAE